MGLVSSILGFFTEPTAYPDSSLSRMSEEEFSSSDLLKTILKKRGNLKEFKVIVGNMDCPFERSGRQNEDKSLRSFSEFGELGYFDYLVVDGYDVSDALPYRLKIDKLLDEGIVEYAPRERLMLDRWAELL